MKEKLDKQLLMQRTVMDHMESNLKLWQNVEALRKNYDRFIRNIKRINDLEAELAESPVSLDTEKEKARKKLAEAILPVVNVLNVIASETGNKKLMKITDLINSDIENQKCNKLLKLGDKILKNHKKLIAVNNKSDKKNPDGSGKLRIVTDHYGLTQDHMDKFQDASQNLNEKVESSDNLKARQIKVRRIIKKRIEENERILSGRIDKIMTVFLKGNKNFFSDYQKIRLSESVLDEKDDNPAKAASS